MKIAICDDEVRDREIIKSHIKEHSAEHTVAEFTSAIPLLEHLSGGEHYDLLFLDVQMPDSDGWEIAKQLKESKIKTYIAMTTVLGNYMCKCFDRVDWFTAKPVDMEDIHMVLDKAYKKLFPTALSFKSGKLSLELTAPEIWYIEVKTNDVFIHTIDCEYRIRKPLKEFKKLLVKVHGFVQIHRSYIINLEYYSDICGSEIVLKNGHHVPLSRSHRAVFFNSLAEFIKGSRKYD